MPKKNRTACDTQEAPNHFNSVAHSHDHKTGHAAFWLIFAIHTDEKKKRSPFWNKCIDTQPCNRPCHNSWQEIVPGNDQNQDRKNKRPYVNEATVSLSKRPQHSLIEMASQLWLICVTTRSCGCSFLRRASAPHPLGRGGSPPENFIFLAAISLPAVFSTGTIAIRDNEGEN